MSIQLGFEDVGVDPTHYHLAQAYCDYFRYWDTLPDHDSAIRYLDGAIQQLAYQDGICPVTQTLEDAVYLGQTDDPDFILDWIGVIQCDRWDCRP